MSATSLLFIIIGVFVIFNAGNIAQVLQGNAKVNYTGAGKRTDTTSTTQRPGVGTYANKPLPT